MQENTRPEDWAEIKSRLIKTFALKRIEPENEFKPRERLAVEAVIDAVEFVKAEIGNSVLCYRPGNKLFKEVNDQMLNSLCLLAIDNLNVNLNINSLKNIMKMSLYSEGLDEDDKLTSFKQPPSHLRFFSDGVYDMRTGERQPDKILYDYHFTRRLSYSMSAEIDVVHASIIDRILDDWSSNDAEVKQFLIDVMRHLLARDVTNLSLVISGEGGNGKSSYMEMLALLIDAKSETSNGIVERLNLDDFAGEFMLQNFSRDTELVIGDELTPNFRFAGKSITRFKQMTSGNSTTVNVKGQAPKTFAPNFLLVQATNTEIRSAEANEAMYARLNCVEWGAVNHRKKESDFDLDELLKDHSFGQSLLTYVMSHSEYNKSIHIPESILLTTQKQVDSGDRTKLFIEELDNYKIIDSSSILPIAVLYKAYEFWSRSENAKAHIVGKTTFARSIEKELAKRGFAKAMHNNLPVSKRIRTFEHHEMDKLGFANMMGINIEQFDELFKDGIKSNYLENADHSITLDDIECIKDSVLTAKPEDVTSLKDIRVIKHFIYDKHDAMIASQYQQSLLDMIDQSR